MSAVQSSRQTFMMIFVRNSMRQTLVRKKEGRFSKYLRLLQCMFFILVAQLYANEQKTQTHKLVGIPEDSRKIKIGHTYIYPLSYFYVQVGAGMASLAGLSSTENKIGITECKGTCIPTFMVGVGFWQQYYIDGLDFGYKIKLTYEVDMKALGDNTAVFRSGGIFLQTNLGYKYVLPYLSIGYEILSVGNNLMPSSGETSLYSSNGVAFGIGSSFLITRYHALEIELRISKIYNYKSRLLFMYEFRF